MRVVTYHEHSQVAEWLDAYCLEDSVSSIGQRGVVRKQRKL
jgi:hypothetical protein